MKRERITGIIEYCYGGIPVVRGYCSYKLLIKHSKAHEAFTAGFILATRIMVEVMQ